MALVITPGYTWSAGETVTATKLNSADSPSIANGQTYTFGAGSAAAPSINFIGGTTTGLYLGSSAVGFSVAGISVGTWSAAGVSTLRVATTGAIASGTYGADFVATSGADRTILRAGVGGISNGFTSEYVSSRMLYTLADGDLLIPSLCAKSSAFTASATTSLANITGLSITLTAGATYYFRAKLLGSGTAVPSAGGIKVAISGTCTATSIIASIAGSFGTAATTPYYRSVVTALDSATSNTPTSDTSLDMTIEGTIVVNTGGTLTIQAAQVTASGVTTVSAGSSLWAQRIS